MKRLLLLLPLAFGCAHEDKKPEPAKVTLFSTAETTRTLHVLHSADHESALLPRDDTGGITRFGRVVEALRTRGPTLLLAAGDTFMPAPALSVEVDGEPGPRRANKLLGYAASALGNHELDLGEGYLAKHIGSAGFPYLSSTVRYASGALARIYAQVPGAEPAPWASDVSGRLVSRAKTCAGPWQGDACDGVVVGLVSAVTDELAVVTRVEDADAARTLDEVRERVQAEVNALVTEGVDVIVLLSHLQDVDNELALVEGGLTGVDLIIAGGGDDRLANVGHRLLRGETRSPLCAAGGSCYPLVRRAADGAPVLIAAADGQHRYVGELTLQLDAAGRVTGVDEAHTRPWPVDDETLQALAAPAAPALAALEEKVAVELAVRTVKVATVWTWLEGRREHVRNRQTNLGDLSADAMQFVGKGEGSRFALRNGGGIRAPIGRVDPKTFARLGGPMTQLDVEEALKFDGPLVVVTATHRALKETLERAFVGAGTGRGHFPQASRELLVEYTSAAPEQAKSDAGGFLCSGRRVRTLRARGPDGVMEIVKDGALITPDAKVTFTTLGYLAKGGDGWFPSGDKGLVIKPLDSSERRSLYAFVEEHEKRGTWKDGAAYPDPVPGQPTTFTRVREVEQTVPTCD
jgi:2',3'-cyclic-nucleotide 2'-phosphodiesterase (5'-nucleotidase family)